MAAFPCIDMIATGANIKNIRVANHLTVRDLQNYFGFDQPQAIYKWQWGECLPSIDNLYALSILFRIPIDKILVGNNQDFLCSYVLSCFPIFSLYLDITVNYPHYIVDNVDKWQYLLILILFLSIL